MNSTRKPLESHYPKRQKRDSFCPTCGERWTLAYCSSHVAPRRSRQHRSPLASVRVADEQTRYSVYKALLADLFLSSDHYRNLRQRGLSDAEIARRQYRTFPLVGRAALARRLVERYGEDVCAGIPGLYRVSRDGRSWWNVAGAAGLLIPVRDLHGRIVALKIRVDNPGEGPKYLSISSVKHSGPSPGAPVHVPLCDDRDTGTARLTEGEVKSDIATALSGTLTVSIPGVAMWRKALPVLQALGPQRVLLAFDADWRTNFHVAQALSGVAFALAREGYTVEVEVWPPEQGKGIDDVLAGGFLPERCSAALAFGAGIRRKKIVDIAGLRTIAAGEVPTWRRC